MKEIISNIEGMHCEGCSSRLERVLNNLDGVENAKVSLADKKAIIKFNENECTLEKIKESIEDAGFEVKGE